MYIYIQQRDWALSHLNGKPVLFFSHLSNLLRAYWILIPSHVLTASSNIVSAANWNCSPLVLPARSHTEMQEARIDQPHQNLPQRPPSVSLPPASVPGIFLCATLKRVHMKRLPKPKPCQHVALDRGKSDWSEPLASQKKPTKKIYTARYSSWCFLPGGRKQFGYLWKYFSRNRS